MSVNKNTEYLFRTLGKEIVRNWCGCQDKPKTMAAHIKDSHDERQILCVLCRISYQLQDVVSALNKVQKGEQK